MTAKRRGAKSSLVPERGLIHNRSSSGLEKQTMFIVIYRWRLKEGHEATFRQGWHEMTESIYRMRGSLGSRLHVGENGTWLAYAQWPDEETWLKARQSGTANEAAAQKMRAGSAELLSEEHLHVVDDLIMHAPIR